jgi:hypothetical protein
MKTPINPTSIKPFIQARRLRLRPLLLAAVASLAVAAISTHAQVVNVLPNPDWAPTSPNGNDGGRDWNFTSGAVQTDDTGGFGDPPVMDGSLGFVVVSVLGGAPDFEYASSQWTSASPGQVWTASINAENQGLNGTQVGVVALAFANSSSSIIGGSTNTVITASSPSSYESGSVAATAPAGTASVQILAGLNDPGAANGSATIWLADASLSSPGVGAASISWNSNAYYTPGLIPFTVMISQGFNNTKPLTVTVSNSNPGVLTLPGEVGGVVTLTFAAGATNTQTIIGQYVTNGTDTLTSGGPNVAGNSVTVNDTLITNSLARTLYAQYAPGLPIDGTGAAWTNLSSSIFYMDTSVNNGEIDPIAPGNFGVDIEYAWDYTNLYFLISEDTNYGAVAATCAEATNATDYLNDFYARDCIAFWLDLSDTSGMTINNQYNGRDPQNADYQPWFGFSTNGLTNLWYSRADNNNVSGVPGLEHAREFTSGTFEAHNRKIEASIEWADIAAAVYPTWQPLGNIASAVKPGLTIGSQPLLIYNTYSVVQTFVGISNYWSSGTGADSNSLNIQLTASDLSPIPVSVSVQSGQLVLAWPYGQGAVSGFDLLTSPTIGPKANWTVIGTTPTVVGNNYQVTVPLSGAPATGYYRLRNLQRQWFFTIGGNL